MNVANALTALRLVAVPVFLVALFTHGGHEPFWRWVAFGVFVLACLTDRLDGHVARKHDMVTEFGKFADPVADKALIGSALVALSSLGELPWWVTAVILFREVGVTALRVWALRDGVVAASLGGKIKTFLQSVAVGLYVAPLASTAQFSTIWRHVLAVVMGGAVLVTVVTGLDYAWRIGRNRSRKGAAHDG